MGMLLRDAPNTEIAIAIITALSDSIALHRGGKIASKEDYTGFTDLQVEIYERVLRQTDIQEHYICCIAEDYKKEFPIPERRSHLRLVK